MENVTFVHCPIADWGTHFLHRVDALAKRSNTPVVEVVIRNDDRNHRPFFGNVPRNTVFMFFDPAGASDPRFPQLVVSCHPVDREAVEARIAEMDVRRTGIEPAPGRNEANVQG